MRTLLRDVELEGRRSDVLFDDARVRSVGGGLPAVDVDELVDGAGGALLPGLHDHHVHLLAMAAAVSSLPCGPPRVRTRDQLAWALRTAPPGPVRGVGYHQSVAGPLDRRVLDELLADRPVRIQHRSGAIWVLNTAALAALPLAVTEQPGAERDAAGDLTGRFWRMDAELRAAGPAPDLGPVRDDLARLGITGVSDATPDPEGSATATLLSAAARVELPTRVLLLGAPSRSPQLPELPPRWDVGPMKLLLHDHDLPVFPDLVARIGAAHRDGRGVAVHCVTVEALVLTLAAIEEAGSHPGDRIEHAAVVPPGSIAQLRRLGPAVVTQPGLLTSRGHDYLRDVAAQDLPQLYRWASLRRAGIPVAASSDAPFGPLDPWQVMVSASERMTPEGEPLGVAERVPAAVALDSYLGPPTAPGGSPRRVVPGAPADLLLLHLPKAEALRAPNGNAVRRVWHASGD